MGNTRTNLAALGSYVTIDVETTGLSPNYCEIIEVGAIRVSDGVMVDTFQSLVKPECGKIPEFIESLTGITNEMLADAPSFADIEEELLSFVGDDAILGHNVCFDIAFLDAQCQSALSNMLIDTKRVAVHVLPDADSYGLSSVYSECKAINSDLPPYTKHHRTIADCELTIGCYETLKPLLIEKYGDDPDAGYAALRKSRRSVQPRKRACDFVPTVEEIDESNPFFNTTICFTGKLNSMTRNVATQVAVNLGATPLDSVSKKLDYLVLGSFDFVACLNGEKSSKLKKAEKLIESGSDLKIVSEDFFLAHANVD